MAGSQDRSGITDQEAARRLARDGPNEIREQAALSPWFLLVGQFRSPLVLLLLAACALSIALGEWIEGAAIGFIVVLNAVIGFAQEYRAETAIAALKRMTAPRARVLREGRQIMIAAREVVTGDLLLLEAGDVVSADARLLEAARLQVNEAVLTGESLPVSKSVDSRVFMGTSVAMGTAVTVVTATGMATELGRIAHLITTAQSGPTPLQAEMARLGRTLLFLCLGVATAVAAVLFLHGKPFVDILVFAVSLAVAAVPEGLPAIVTVALALGVQRMAGRNALIRKLPSVETLGSVTVICTDKTGTLTMGRMRVREIWGPDHAELLLSACACCDAELSPDGLEGTGDPTEIAILMEGRERGISREAIERESPRVRTEPFDPVRKLMSVHRRDGFLHVKGALEAVLPLCGGMKDAGAAERANADLAARGLRVLAVARGQGPEELGLTFLGLVGIADPPRTEAIDAVREARSAGILPIMITGDHPATAIAIARETGLILEDEEPGGRVHARATPEDKLELVRHWKTRGAIVAMTGDGVNDAPALREAHIGIAMGKGGTEVTRQAADLVLSDDNFATIVAAVREGRAVYRNIRKTVLYLLTGNFGELATVVGAAALGLPLPLLAAQLLWINLVTDSLPNLALLFDPMPPDLMARPPRSSAERLIGRPEWKRILWVGLLEGAVVLALFAWLLRGRAGETAALEHARSMAFSALVFSQLFRSFSARSSTRLFWQVGALSNLWLLGVVALSGILQISLHYLPVSREALSLTPFVEGELPLILGAALVPVTFVELAKIRFPRRR